MIVSRILSIASLIVLCFHLSPSMSQSCTYTEESKTLECKNYTSLSSLDIVLSGKIHELILRPILERPHSFGDELIILFDEIKSYFEDGYNVLLENFIDFDIGFNPFYSIYESSGQALGGKLTIDRSILEFKSNGIDFNCTRYVSSTQKKMFAMFKEVHFAANTLYREGQCPIIFGDSDLNLVRIAGVDYVENVFSFAKFNNETTVYRSNVDRVLIEEANLRTLDSSILSVDVFKQATEIAYYSGLRAPGLLEIEDNLFKQFKALRRLYISVNDFELFALSSSGTWMNVLNPEKADNFQLNLIDQGKAYEFPTKDFCAFSQLTQLSRIVVRIEGKESLECTCTLAWLIQYSPVSTQTETTRSCFEDNSAELEELKRTCNFQTRVKDCTAARSTTTAAPTTIAPVVTTRLIKDPKPDNTTTIVFGVLGGVAILIIIAVIAIYYRRKTTTKQSYAHKPSYISQDEENINIVKINKK